MVVSQLLLLSIGITDTFTLGLLGKSELASGGLINSYVLLLYLTVTGFAVSILSVNGRSYGRSDKDDVASNFNASLAMFGAFGLFGLIMIWNLNPVLGYFQVDDGLLTMTENYNRIVAVAFFLSCITIMLRFYLISIDKAKYLSTILSLGFLVNLALNLLLAGIVTDSVDFGMDGIAISSVITNAFLIMLLLLKKAQADEYASYPFCFSFQRIWVLCLVGFPLAAIICIETLLFTASHTMISHYGADHLVAFSYFLLVLDIIIMFPVGMSHCVAARLSISIGEKAESPDLAPAVDALLLTILLPVLFGIFVILLNEEIFLALNFGKLAGEAELIGRFNHVSIYIPVIAVLSGLIIVFAAIFRSIDLKSKFSIHVLIGYWFVGIGCAYTLSTYTKLDSQGIYVGIALGFLYALVMLCITNRDSVVTLLGRTPMPGSYN
ncbi:MAG: hypothetical protein GY784_04980 [Gammaproteobacteria bacterium]|nr:hypothetical protein [Gammaproteobacteria bacterium]